MTKRNIYLETVAPEEAVRRAKASLNRNKLIGSKTIPPMRLPVM